MGYEVKRVPMDFDWPVGRIWEGYVNPYRFPPCPDCGRSVRHVGLIERAFAPDDTSGDGYSPEARAIAETFYPHMIEGPNAIKLAWHNKIGQAEVDELLKHGRLHDFHERWDAEARKWVSTGDKVTAEAVNYANTHERERTAQHHAWRAAHPDAKLGTAHDAINRSILIDFRCRRLGIPHYCATCDGEGDIATKAERKQSEEWERTEPPTGDGYQVWETVSEGSPVSPVRDYEGIVTWLQHWEHHEMTRRGAEKFVAEAWAPTLVSHGHGVEYGVEAIDREAREG